jgi:hypothetical protein
LYGKTTNYIMEIDPFNLNIRKKEYWEIYSNKLINNIKENNWIIYMVYDEKNCIWCIAWIVKNSEYLNKNIDFTSKIIIIYYILPVK